MKVRLMAVFILVLASACCADIIAGVPQITAIPQKNLELGSTSRMIFNYINRTGNDIDINALYLQFSYPAELIDNILQIKSLLSDELGKLAIEKSGGKFTFKFSFKRAFKVKNGESLELFAVAFHLNQNYALTERKQLNLFDISADSQVLAGNQNLIGRYFLSPVQLFPSEPPEFTGVSSVKPEKEGNAIIVEWITPATGARDKTFYPNGKLNYKILRSDSETTQYSVVGQASDAEPFTGNTGTDYIFRDSGEESPLSAGATYYYKVTAADDCSPVPNVQENTRVLAVTLPKPNLTLPPSTATVDFTPSQKTLASVDNFMVISGMSEDEVILYWQNPDDINYKGAIILYSNDPNAKWNSIGIVDGRVKGKIGAVVPNRSGPGGDEIESIKIEPGKRYYFAIYPYSGPKAEVNPTSEEELKNTLIAEPAYAALDEEVPPKIKLFVNDAPCKLDEEIILDKKTEISAVYEESAPYGVRPGPIVMDEGKKMSQVMSASKSDANSAVIKLPESITDGAHKLKFSADSLGELGKPASTSAELNFKIVGGPLQLSSMPLVFPSPFSIRRDKEVVIQYQLSQDANIDLSILSPSGERLKHFIINKGEDGGKAGVNKLTWNGRKVSGSLSGNGIYLGTIVARDEGRILGKFKLTMFD